MSRVRPWLWSGAAYSAFTLAICHRVLSHPASALPSDLGDPLLNAWLLWWNAHATPLTRAWWNAPIFYPMEGALALSETLLGIAILTSPLQWVGLSVVTVYNVAFAGSFVASALAAHLLVWCLTRRHDAAFVAGLVYGFSPYRIAHAPHLQILSSYWLPLALVGLHQYVQRGRLRDLALFACCWTLQALVSGYFLFYSSLLVALWIVWFGHRAIGRAAAIAATWAAALLACLPVLLEYRKLQTALDLQRGINEIEIFGADLSSLFAPAGRLIVWGERLVSPRAEGELFLGFTAAIVIAAAAWRTVRGPVGRVSAALLAIAAVPIAVGLAAFLSGGFAIGFITVTRAFKPISMGVWIATIAVLVSIPFRRALRNRSAFGFYVFATAVLFAFALGPTPRVLGHRFWYQAPYRVLLQLPGFTGVRVPARFAAIATLTFATAAGLGFDRLRPAARARARLALGAVVAGIVIDSASIVPAASVPVWADTFDVSAAAAVLELPLGEPAPDVLAMFHMTRHGRPVVNGYSGYSPPHYAALTVGLREDARTFDVLRRGGPIAVIVSDSNPAAGAWANVQANGVRMIGRHAGGALFWLDRSTSAAAQCRGESVPVAGIRASGGNDPKRAIDNSRETAWHSMSLQNGGEQIVIDLGAPRRLEMVTLAHGPFARDFARTLRVEASADDQRWTELWSGSLASYTAEGTLADPRMAPAKIPLPSALPWRFLALTQTGQAREAMWSIAEIEVCGSAATN